MWESQWVYIIKHSRCFVTLLSLLAPHILGSHQKPSISYNTLSMNMLQCLLSECHAHMFGCRAVRQTVPIFHNVGQRRQGGCSTSYAGKDLLLLENDSRFQLHFYWTNIWWCSIPVNMPLQMWHQAHICSDMVRNSLIICFLRETSVTGNHFKRISSPPKQFWKRVKQP